MATITRPVIQRIAAWPAILLLNLLRRARSVYYAAAAGSDGLVQHQPAFLVSEPAAIGMEIHMPKQSYKM